MFNKTRDIPIFPFPTLVRTQPDLAVFPNFSLLPALTQLRNVGVQEMDMASELSFKNRKTIFGMVAPRTEKDPF